jgi:hypothetical protein
MLVVPSGFKFSYSLLVFGFFLGSSSLALYCMAQPDGHTHLASPARAFVQGHTGGRLPPESALVVEEMRRRGVPVAVLTSEEFLQQPPVLTRADFVVGDFSWTRAALRMLGVPMPAPPDYPACLRPLLHRRVWMSTLGEVHVQLLADPARQLFIKPAADIKAFAGLVASVDWLPYLLEQHAPALPVVCSELVEMVAEYRAYVVLGELRAVCQYLGPADAPLDMDIVKSAVSTLCASAEGEPLAGCGVDFAVMRIAGPDRDGALATTVTGLVEVNDALSLGAYEGLSARDYTDMLLARWARLMAS